MTIGFPTLGELINYAFKATGIMPNKWDNSHPLSATDKKILQKSLHRLAAEEGNINENSIALIHQFAKILANSIKSEKMQMVITETSRDLLEVYCSVITDDGTYLDKPESIRWVLSAYIISRLANSINKHSIRFNVASEGFIFPDDLQWFSPTLNHDKIDWPLGKTMAWIYQLYGVSQIQFHYPEPGPKLANTPKSNQLENAQHWSQGKNIPSWDGLQYNFAQALDVLEQQRPELKNTRPSIMLALFIARLVTYIAQDIEYHYGKEFLSELMDVFLRHSDWLKEPIKALKQVTEKIIAESHCPPELIDSLYFMNAERFWREAADIIIYAARDIESILHENNNQLTAQHKDQFTSKYGQYITCQVIDLIERQQHTTNKVPDGFAECLSEFFSLKQTITSPAEIFAFSNKLDSYGLAHTINWATPWLQATLCYRNMDWPGAYAAIKIAFENAKYSAGRNQHPLVNQYLHACAKNNKWREFKKGAAWAYYLGIKVRFLDNDEPSDENVASAFELMQQIDFAW